MIREVKFRCAVLKSGQEIELNCAGFKLAYAGY